MKKTITKAERLQLIGLQTLAEHHNAHLKEIEGAAHAILDIRDDDEVGPHKSDPKDYVSDMLYSNETLADTLKNMGVKVKP